MKKNIMKTLASGITIAMILGSTAYSAEQIHSSNQKGKAEKSSENMDGNRSGSIHAKVASILSKYNPATLNAADAKAINNAFREAGIKRGPEQKEAIEKAGFDPKKISSLDPPPAQKKQDKAVTKNMP